TPWEIAAVTLLMVSVTGNTLAQPATSALISRAAGPDRQGAILGVSAATGALARVVGPTIAGFIYSGVGHYAPFLFAGVVLCPAIFLAWRGGLLLKMKS